MSVSVEARAGGFHVVGDMTLETAASLFSKGIQISTEPTLVFDLTAVDEVDSSGLAVLFGWMRAAEAQGKTLRIDNPPANLVSLAQVYDVSDLLPLS
ncbi:MAG: STAS domain-containing protein [Rhodocyclaceae bacterium]|nr:STAS domain-containing protein [Rhodocyclaceae bacterium]MDZ4213846.1 STAS domain-containing protein [Rhodocyclaceae bacterium]